MSNTIPSAVLSASQLSYQYRGGTLLSFPDLHLDPGEVLLVLGPSGCGKTTLLHLLAGLLPPRTGSIALAGQSYNYTQPAVLDQIRGRNLGIVYQQPHFIDTLTAWQNLRLSPFAQSKEELLELAQQIGIAHLLKKYPQEMSAGELQRLGIARALAHRPGLILADEPTSALDRRHCLAVLERLQTHARQYNAALLIVTHDDRLMTAIPQQITLDYQPAAAQNQQV
ncbi:ATP-binding cassette domain-containing protein [Neolewinella lacunae]|uniref:ATP-binding cassette domain-containing protein n=1 Tax=Neolewinella lacunae TaxID=1517758 RepID=A0A923PKP1_9BACT|nr:ATP-binding cassette domain-containing protein [Neolewinella lacunae]MBC6995129.1 ATP-binding cassette domain-containing protein [Neolewinella lacunae]MDN3634079.1 ATP-binding cassette domain-containing protein [Neolewinella lacunae]